MTDAAEVQTEEGSDPATEATPQPLFTELGLAEDVTTAIAAMGYERATAVQTAVIGPAMEGKDLVVQSETGSGKTSAFGIPMVSRLEAGAAGASAPQALVLVPTRELANQVADELRKLATNKGVSVVPVYGGVSMGRQVASLKEGADIVVGTPGRLHDHIRRKNMTLADIKMICLDEADEMLSMGFWDDVTDLIKKCPDTRQTMLFSATLPYQVAKAAAEFLKEPARLDLSRDEVTVEGITNAIMHVLAEIPKPRQLLYLLETENPKSAIIFCNTRNETEMIAKYLTQSGFVAEAISGNFHQKARERVMERIKSGDLAYMVATDVASRGIDISNLSHVFNYALPEFTEVYVHRVGRTGRMGRIGRAVSLVDGRGLGTLTQLEREFKISFEEITLPDEDEILARRSQRIMKDLSEKASVAEVGQHLTVARDILGAEDAPQVVAFLLKSYFNAEAFPVPAAKTSEHDSPTKAKAKPERAEKVETDDEAGKSRRRRRRRRRRRGGDELPMVDAAEALGLPPPANPNNNGGSVASGNGNHGDVAEGMTRVRVNIGFDDGFKGRGAVAKKITALAGLNDGIVTEVESRRGYAVLQATTDIAELLIERVDGAQIGKKIVEVANVTPAAN